MIYGENRVKLILGLLISTLTLSGEPHYYLLTHRLDKAGLFSVFHTVLGALDFMEQDDRCCGLGVNFENKGFYYDKSLGENWWNYYFEPIEIGQKTDIIKKIPHYKKICWSVASEFAMSRERGYELIAKYIIPKPHIQKKIDLFCEKNFKNKHVIGIHYRGTDKCSEAQIVPYCDVYDCVAAELIKLDKDYVIFVATDDMYFLSYMNAYFPGRIVCTDAIRSDSGAAVHFAETKLNYQKGEDAIIDCILLSKCDLLIKTDSNLSNCSIKFNPHIPYIMLNKSNGQS